MLLITTYESYILLLRLNMNINQESLAPVLISSDTAFHCLLKSVEGSQWALAPFWLKFLWINIAQRRRHLYMQACSSATAAAAECAAGQSSIYGDIL